MYLSLAAISLLLFIVSVVSFKIIAQEEINAVTAGLLSTSKYMTTLLLWILLLLLLRLTVPRYTQYIF